MASKTISLEIQENGNILRKPITYDFCKENKSFGHHA